VKKNKRGNPQRKGEKKGSGGDPGARRGAVIGRVYISGSCGKRGDSGVNEEKRHRSDRDRQKNGKGGLKGETVITRDGSNQSTEPQGIREGTGN